MKLKQRIFNHACSRQPSREIAYPDYSQIRSVFLLYESDWMERNPEIRAMVQQLQENDKQVVSWGYCKKDKVLSPNLPESRMLGVKDFTWLQKPKKELIRYLERHEFDVLINLCGASILPMQYMALYAHAKFKIGASDLPLYDMVIQSPIPMNSEYNFQQIIHYLKLIKSAD